MNPKVVTVLAGAPVGGAETFFISLTGAFARSGFQLRSVLKPNSGREAALRAAGIGFHTAPFSTPFDWRTKGVIRRVAAEFHPDVVLAFAGRAASFVPKGNYRIVGRLGGYYNLASFRSCDHLVCNSPDVLRHVTEAGWPSSRASLIPNFPYLVEAPAANRAEFQTPQMAPLVVALGRLHRNKGLDVLIRATAKIPELFVWIAGDGPEASALQQLSHGLRLSDRIRFLGWRNDRAALYAAADLCVYPSREEPFGNVVVEAWSCGVPLIATRTPGPAWLIRENEDAILVPADDAESLAAAIRMVLASPPLRERLISGGRRRVADEFSQAAVVNRYSALFQRLAA